MNYHVAIDKLNRVCWFPLFLSNPTSMLLVRTAKVEVHRLTNMTRVLDHQRARLEQIGSDVGRNLAILKERIWQAREQAKNVSRCWCLCMRVCVRACVRARVRDYSDLYSFADRIDIIYWWTFKYTLHFICSSIFTCEMLHKKYFTALCTTGQILIKITSALCLSRSKCRCKVMVIVYIATRQTLSPVRPTSSVCSSRQLTSKKTCYSSFYGIHMP